MKKITKIAALAVLVMGVAATLQPANAICGSARLIGATSYVVTPGCEALGCGSFNSSVTDDATGVFWGFTEGNTAVGAGIDNGSFPFLGGWGYIYPGYAALITSSWGADPGIDGCIDFANAATNPAKCMAVLLMDNSPSTGAGAFALITKKPDNLINFDLTQAGDINLASLGAPVIANSASIGGGASIDVTVSGVQVADIEGGLYLDPDCPAGAPVSGILGYQVYVQNVPTGQTPGDNDVQNWTPAGPLTPLGDSSTANVPCGASGTSFLTYALAFDSGFVQMWLSGESTAVNCDATLADPEDLSPRKPRNRETPRSRTKR